MQFSIRVVLLMVVAMVADHFGMLPSVFALLAGASTGVFLFGPTAFAVGKAVADMKGEKEIRRFAENLDQILASNNVPLARKLLARVQAESSRDGDVS